MEFAVFTVSHVVAFVVVLVLGAILIAKAADTPRGAGVMIIYVAGTASMFAPPPRFCETVNLRGSVSMRVLPNVSGARVTLGRRSVQAFGVGVRGLGGL